MQTARSTNKKHAQRQRMRDSLRNTGRQSGTPQSLPCVPPGHLEALSSKKITQKTTENDTKTPVQANKFIRNQVETKPPERPNFPPLKKPTIPSNISAEPQQSHPKWKNSRLKSSSRQNSDTIPGFSTFEQSQIREFKEAFQLMDANNDGIIDVSDLCATYQSLGISKPKSSLQAMVDEALGPINFTIFLNMLAERMGAVDPEDTLLEAFSVFDSDGNGKINKECLADILRGQADRFTDAEISGIMAVVNQSERGDQVDYKALVHILTHGISSDDGDESDPC